ncbi:STAS domain-containing protein [Mesobacillus jeotgali]|jgi:rsbT co-antagonist protein RsbR|uniref:STAS domain-containing protein n=1 Tax=Mesobacillus jeotgali TaxID=129985 RepID=A0ABY9VTF6_9BACI|nr:STAS domain-containing protein [Mesobacillus jeotgali]WNF25052.1 STAS domain-containing protein [Mesobacillus jeotgali]
METRSKALYEYLVEHATNFTEDWMKRQRVIKGSDYSADAPAEVMNRVKEQNSNYVRLVAKSLYQTEEEMKETISAWTSQTAADRIKSKTDLTEVAWNSGVFRRVYWEYVQKFVKQTEMEITLDDVFTWEKKINYTLDYVFETFIVVFMEILMNRLASQATLIKELSAPVISLTKEVGLLPLIGEIDTTRAKGLMESTLTQSIDARINTLIVDLSGVVMVDTMVAHQIFKLMDALNLLGVRSIVTGIRPEVAQTAVQLGIDFSGITTEGNLQNVVKKIIQS